MLDKEVKQHANRFIWQNEKCSERQELLSHEICLERPKISAEGGTRTLMTIMAGGF